MDQRKTTNFLLLVIAICLSLIVVHLYGLSLAQPVEAEQAADQKAATEKPKNAEVAKTPLAVAFVNPQRVELVYQGRDGVMYSLADRDGRLSCKADRE